ncbi:CGNR zinc finger domain-containing protein [Brevibacterium spongiae]|uniref:CGNR zinc finger domain-containing protein n=1 Tax=Brevibacterium spongiae TaxID=2909672 RepID=A0ABY5SLN3_9MICO|nr:CGNR zinc finger domain-containing protein [Brevibacterium spongiae]UVI35447.1 CGNR zinc finger domain-containing protein [Brevibacterium spongiae]
MTFAYDIRSNLLMLVDLLNTSGTVAAAGDELTTTAGIREFAARHDFSGPIRATKSDVEETQRLRERFASALDASIDAQTDAEASDAVEAVVDEVNITLRTSGSMPQLVRHGSWNWHLHATGSDDSLADRVAADVALVLIDLIRSGDLDRLGRCAAEDCRAYLADFSRNRSKRFCDTGSCANRTHVAAFRARQSDAETDR